MLYYRYRPMNGLSTKELMYNEIYLASSKECNDPYDSEYFYTFKYNKENWNRLITFAWTNIKKHNPNMESQLSHLADKLSDLLSKYPTLNMNDATKEIFFEQINQVNYQMQLENKMILVECIVDAIEMYKPNDVFYACFSKANNSILMWSHYTYNHQGYCLIFKDIDSKLKLKPYKQSNNEYINYSFKEIKYKDNTDILDAFILFPKTVNQYDFKDECERNEYFKIKEERYLEKHTCWEYEKEVRIMQKAPSKCVFGTTSTFNPLSQIYHYDPSQLVGIIFGAKMNNENKTRLFEIIQEQRRLLFINTNKKDTTIFNFAIFDSILSPNLRELKIEPKKIFTLDNNIIENHQYGFEKELLSWEIGSGIHFSKNGSATPITV